MARRLRAPRVVRVSSSFRAPDAATHVGSEKALIAVIAVSHTALLRTVREQCLGLAGPSATEVGFGLVAKVAGVVLEVTGADRFGLR